MEVLDKRFLYLIVLSVCMYFKSLGIQRLNEISKVGLETRGYTIALSIPPPGPIQKLSDDTVT